MRPVTPHRIGRSARRSSALGGFGGWLAAVGLWLSLLAVGGFVSHEIFHAHPGESHSHCIFCQTVVHSLAAANGSASLAVPPVATAYLPADPSIYSVLVSSWPLLRGPPFFA